MTMREQLEALERKWREKAHKFRFSESGTDILLEEVADDLRAILDGFAGEACPSGTCRLEHVMGRCREGTCDCPKEKSPPAVVVDTLVEALRKAKTCNLTTEVRNVVNAAITASLRQENNHE